MLAGAKTKGGTDGDWILPKQQGTIVVREFKEINNGLKKSVLFVGEVLESHAKEAGAVTQPAGTRVKIIYALSKRDWAIDNLKTDIVNMTGIDEKSLSPKDLAELFRVIFVDGSMTGYAVNFSSELKTTDKDGKPRATPLTKVYFREATGEINEESAVKARAEKIKAELKAA
jgi:hypothetical protein